MTNPFRMVFVTVAAVAFERSKLLSQLCKAPHKTIEQLFQIIRSADFARGQIYLEMSSCRDDHLMCKLLEDSIKMVNDYYQLPLRWRSRITSLPDNPGEELNRLMCL